MAVKLFKDGNKTAIETNCKNQDDFIEEFSVILSKMIEDGSYNGDWERHLRGWFPQMVDICNAMNGYKNQVEKQTVYISGNKIIGKEPVFEFDLEEETTPAQANGFPVGAGEK